MKYGFTVEEVNLMCIFDTSGKDALIAELTAAMPEFTDQELKEIAKGILYKLGRMTDAEFSALGLYPEYDDYIEESEA